MERRTRTRAILASTAAVAVSLVVAPQWASGSDAVAAPTAEVTVSEQPATTTEPSSTIHVASTSEPTATTVADAPSTTTSTTVLDAPTAPAVADPAPAPDAEPAPSTADDPVPAAYTTVAATTGTIRIEVTTTEGASRTVSLRSADGSPVGGPVAVDGAPVVFDDLAAGTYDVFVEQLFDDGATFVTRTTVTVDGNAVTLACDAETLDCAAS